MKKLLLIFILLLAAMMAAWAEVSADDRLQKLESYLDEVAEAYHIPGMAVVITSPEETLFEKAYGQCTSLDQQFYIGSMSKSYTAVCIMQLIEKGLVSLDADVSTYLPDYKFEKPVTLLALLNQTSGFDTHAKLHNVKQKDSYGKYEYANVNYDLLGKIVEAVSGQSYEDYIQQNVFGPLGMEASRANAWAVKDSPKLLLGNRNYFGFFKKGPAVFPVEKSWFHEPAGYIASTPHDHAKYLRMYLNDGLQILTPEGIQKMWFKNVSEGANQYDAYYGMGWNYMNWNGQPMLFHGGQVENGITFQYILPDNKLAVCFMINASDYLVMNNLMNGVIFDSIAILNGGESGTVNHKTWLLLHLALNAIYLVLIGLSVFVLIMAIKARLNLVFKIVGCVLWPVLLLSFLPLFLSTPLWVVRLYVPDLYLVIITAAAIAFAGGIITCVRFLRRR
ncbi:MAG: beta-lactamase family protein [Treponema sp.]|nr:beta-lactamase family protein [Treponema sp.]